MLLVALERRGKGGVGNHPVGIQIAKIEFPALFIFASVCGNAVGSVCVQPAVGLHIEPDPVMAAAEIGFCGETAFPAGGNTGAAAEGQEQQRKHAAVAVEIPGAGLGPTGGLCIFLKYKLQF